MGTAFIDFTISSKCASNLYLDEIWNNGQMSFSSLQIQLSNNSRNSGTIYNRSQDWRLTVEIGKIVFRSLLEAMELDRPDDQAWKGHLDAAYGIKYLYVGEKKDADTFDFGPALLGAIKYVRENGPPDYYPENDLDLLNEQLDQLEVTYLQCRDK